MSEYRDPYMKTYSTDIVRLVCDLAYMPVSIAKELEFNELYIFKRMLEKRNEHRQKILELTYAAKAAANNSGAGDGSYGYGEYAYGGQSQNREGGQDENVDPDEGSVKAGNESYMRASVKSKEI